MPRPLQLFSFPFRFWQSNFVILLFRTCVHSNCCTALSPIFNKSGNMKPVETSGNRAVCPVTTGFNVSTGLSVILLWMYCYHVTGSAHVSYYNRRFVANRQYKTFLLTSFHLIMDNHFSATFPSDPTLDFGSSNFFRNSHYFAHLHSTISD